MNSNYPETLARLDSMANEFDDPPQEGRGNIEPGVIYTANASRFVQGNFDEPLTQYAVGFQDPENIEESLEFVAPKVSVPRRFTYAVWSNPQEFLSEDDDTRGEDGDFKRVEYTSTKSSSQTVLRGLCVRVDREEFVDSPTWEQQIVGAIMRRLLRNSYRRAFAALSAAASNTGKTWTVAATANPDSDLRLMRKAYQDLAGLRPNRILMGDAAWTARYTAYAGQLTAGSIANCNLTEAQVASLVGVNGLKVSYERYQSAVAAKSQVVGLYVLGFLATGGSALMDPSNIKRFVSPTEGGTPFKVWRQEVGPTMVDIAVMHYENTVVTSTLGVQQYTITAS